MDESEGPERSPLSRWYGHFLLIGVLITLIRESWIYFSQNGW